MDQVRINQLMRLRLDGLDINTCKRICEIERITMDEWSMLYHWGKISHIQYSTRAHCIPGRDWYIKNDDHRIMDEDHPAPDFEV